GHHGGGHHGGGHHGQLGNIEARAAFSCDFELDPSFPMELVGPAIARDRMYMAGMPGLVHGKHLPLSIDFQTGQFFSGGRYLFDTKSNATHYREFVTEDYVLDGFQFLERPGVLDPSCFQWKNIAAYEFGDIGTDHVVMRTERWSIPGHGNKTHFLRSLAEDLSEDAEGRGLTGVWLLYNRQERFVEIVHVGGRVGPIEPGELDVASVGALATAPTLGEEFDERGWDKVLDRTHFVLSIWFPFELGDQGEPAVWPNSPPLPEPYCGDALCVPSRGEDAVTCPQDCTINCGDAVCQPGEGEDTANCPGDCRL
ncbi:MAG: hypothetical protein JKY37_31405, partial [Nannocystaceae bacterium]|nr:hypothetical protein [Nannocystaceae bacterium]